MQDERYEARRQLITKIAWLYYKNGFTQQQIADHLGTSRLRVIKLLAAALEEGIVRITVTSPYVEAFELEKQLCAIFGLNEAVVVPKLDQPDDLRRAIGGMAASYLERILTNSDILGTAWGQTVLEAARQLHPPKKLPDLLLVQLMGGFRDSSGSENPLDIAQVIAEKYHSRYLNLFAPAIVDNSDIRDILLSDQGIKRVIETARRATKALVGIGSASDNSTLAKTGFAGSDILRGLTAKGAVGDIVGRFYNIDGCPIESDLDSRTISIELESVRQIPCVIGLAGGPNKVEAILGALRGNYLKILITDEETAAAVIRLNNLISDPRG